MKRLAALAAASMLLALAGVVGPVAAHDKTTICHVPPGNEGNPQTLELPEAALQAHLGDNEDGLHGGDYRGECRAPEPTPTPTPKPTPTPTEDFGFDLGLLGQCFTDDALYWQVLMADNGAPGTFAIDGELLGSGATFSGEVHSDGDVFAFGKPGDGDLSITPSGEGVPVAQAEEPSEPCVPPTGGIGEPSTGSNPNPPHIGFLPPTDTAPADVDANQDTIEWTPILAFVAGVSVGLFVALVLFELRYKTRP